MPRQNAVIGIQRDHVRHRAKRNQIEQISQVRRCNASLIKPAFVTQESAQRQHQIESYTNACQRFRRELTVVQVRIDDRLCARQRIPWQVVIGYNDRDPQRSGMFDTHVRRDAVVYGNNQLSTPGMGLINDFRA